MDPAYFATCLADGTIIGRGFCPSADLPAQVPLPGQSIVEISEADYARLAEPFDYRLLDGAVVERDQVISPTISKPEIVADGQDECVITGLPDPCTVRIAGAVTWGPGPVAGGSLTLTSTVPGEIRLTITCDPTHKPWTGVVNAT